MGTAHGGNAFSAYESFAGIYDDFNHRNDFEMWLGGKLLPELETRGLRKGRVLDVGCGTGGAFEPLLRRGFEVHGCDISPAMLERARERFGGRVELDVADMRELPVFGEFDLALALGDAVNHLTGEGELQRGLAGIGANLADRGLVLFDCNSRLTYRLSYESAPKTIENEGRRWTWTGLGRADEDVPIYRARIEGDGTGSIVHESRYFEIGEVEARLESTGMECLAVLGQREQDNEVVLSEPADERRDHKIVYIARRRRASRGPRLSVAG